MEEERLKVTVATLLSKTNKKKSQEKVSEDKEVPTVITKKKYNKTLDSVKGCSGSLDNITEDHSRPKEKDNLTGVVLFIIKRHYIC